MFGFQRWQPQLQGMAIGTMSARQRFQGGLAFKADRLLYHSTLGLRVIKKKTRRIWHYFDPEWGTTLQWDDHSENSETESCTDRYSSQFENNYFTEMCSGSDQGSYLRLTDFCITHSSLASNKEEKKKDERHWGVPRRDSFKYSSLHLQL